MGLVYSIIAFGASLRGSEGLKLDLESLIINLEKGRNDGKTSGRPARSNGYVIIPIKGRFKGEKGEQCHLLPLANVMSTGIEIRSAVELMVAVRREMSQVTCPWAFVTLIGSKMTFAQMNEIVLERLEMIKENDQDQKSLGLDNYIIREDFSINCSFRRGSSTHAQNQKYWNP